MTEGIVGDLVCLSKDWVYLALITMSASLIAIWVTEIWHAKIFKKLNKTNDEILEFLRKNRFKEL